MDSDLQLSEHLIVRDTSDDILRDVFVLQAVINQVFGRDAAVEQLVRGEQDIILLLQHIQYLLRIVDNEWTPSFVQGHSDIHRIVQVGRITETESDEPVARGIVVCGVDVHARQSKLAIVVEGHVLECFDAVEIGLV